MPKGRGREAGPTLAWCPPVSGRFQNTPGRGSCQDVLDDLVEVAHSKGMRPYQVELVANCPKTMRTMQAVAVRHALEMGECQAPGAAAKLVISVECWRDENGRLHCKVSVSWTAATA